MATRLTVIKRMTYRGDTGEEWSNTYHLDGGDPADATAWNTIFTAMATAEKTCYGSASKICRAYGHVSDDPSAASVWSKDLDVSGPLISGTFSAGGQVTAGDQAAYVWWKTARLTSTGKPIYLRKFFHTAYVNSSAPDELNPSYITNLEAFATLLASGAGVDGRHIRGPGVASDTIYDSGAGPYITTRTLKRRGKRPTPAP